MTLKLSRIIAALLLAAATLFANSAFAVHPSFDDHPEHTRTNNPHMK